MDGPSGENAPVFLSKTHHDIHHDQARNVRGVSGTSTPIPGKPDVRELIQILQHLMFCAQSCKTPISLQIILFLTLPENIWIANTREKYPILPKPPPPIANYEGSVYASDRDTTKSELELSKKTFGEWINTNAALVTRFLLLTNPTFKTCYELTQLIYPNAPLLNVFDFFMRK